MHIEGDATARNCCTHIRFIRVDVAYGTQCLHKSDIQNYILSCETYRRRNPVIIEGEAQELSGIRIADEGKVEHTFL